MKSEKIIAAGILPICIKTGRILLIRRGLNQPQPGTWATFGGKYEEEEDNTPKDIAMREFTEESGYHGKFKISNKPLDVFDSNHLKFYTFVGLFEEEFMPKLEEENEGIDYGWFSLNNTPDDLHPGVKDMFLNKMKTIENIVCFFKNK